MGASFLFSYGRPQPHRYEHHIDVVGLPKKQNPQRALERCTELIGKVPALERAPEINAWLEETVLLLS